MELLLGCGRNHEKKISFPGIPNTWSKDLVRLDIDETVGPDVVHDLNITPYPFGDNIFDEIHAYEVLEHCGTQGDYIYFFEQFSELWRILKPGGWLIGTCPRWDSVWAWSDPGHTRIISPQSFLFLSQAKYEEQVEKTAMTDYRHIYEADFELYTFSELEENWAFALRAIKDEYKPADN